VEDYYQVLGADPQDSQERIKRCFRQRAKELHPDLTLLHDDQAESRMRLLLDAYRVLGDPERRSEYDRLHGHALRRRRFDYRSFLRARADPVSLAKLVLYDLMRSRDREALTTLGQLESHIESDLAALLDHDDFMDCAYLLAEALERDGAYGKACEYYLRVYHAEATRPYFRHFIAEVVERMREVACFKMAGTAETADSVRWIEELIDLDLSDRESAFFCKRIAEIYSNVGDFEAARGYLQRALRLDERIAGVKKLKERVGLHEPVMQA
jgi:curved DNA-binding protein CbpA